MFEGVDGNPETIGVILAGGLSSRMKQDKAQLVLPSGKNLLAHAENLMASLPLTEVIVSGKQGVSDIYPKRGPLGGILAIAKRYPGKRLLVIPVDMPLLKPEVLSKLLITNNPNNVPVVYLGYPLPLLLSLTKEVVDYLNDAMQGLKSASIKSMLMEFQCIQLPELNEEYFFNCNTPEEFAFICQQLN
ncbi:molybdenum cofactor guanylyltransferase [Zooshikella harenae]|uniref:Molybdenum cofactor guanylyltransferase n=1 Tax=Zooshikella harenae TaxID=2827238 RepID=A0ABS5ZBJ7_9GAMM|nr:molybdenum cofactor guanylyltransferase [Zooshikella harenae]MBU2710625.1 molybdenum cofactor guanylyltransferase [Zooshikella harenae]